MGKLWGVVAKPSCLLIKITARQFTVQARPGLSQFYIAKGREQAGRSGSAGGCGQMVDWRRFVCLLTISNFSLQLRRCPTAKGRREMIKEAAKRIESAACDFGFLMIFSI